MADVKNMSRPELEAHSRNLEAKMNVLRSKASQNEAFDKPLGETNKEYEQVSRRLADMDNERREVDLEGTAPTLSDRTGAFAPDAETARLGGVGIHDSNENPDEARKVKEESEDTEKVQKRAEENQESEKKASVERQALKKSKG